MCITWCTRKPLNLRAKQFRMVVNDDIKKMFFDEVVEKSWKLKVLVNRIYDCLMGWVQWHDGSTAEERLSISSKIQSRHFVLLNSFEYHYKEFHEIRKSPWSWSANWKTGAYSVVLEIEFLGLFATMIFVSFSFNFF